MPRRRSMLGVAYAGGLKEESTAFAGAGLLVELFRQCGAWATAEQVLPKKRAPKGLRQWAEHLQVEPPRWPPTR